MSSMLLRSPSWQHLMTASATRSRSASSVCAKPNSRQTSSNAVAIFCKASESNSVCLKMRYTMRDDAARHVLFQREGAPRLAAAAFLAQQRENSPALSAAFRKRERYSIFFFYCLPVRLSRGGCSFQFGRNVATPVATRQQNAPARFWESAGAFLSIIAPTDLGDGEAHGSRGLNLKQLDGGLDCF